MRLFRLVRPFGCFQLLLPYFIRRVFLGCVVRPCDGFRSWGAMLWKDVERMVIAMFSFVYSYPCAHHKQSRAIGFRPVAHSDR